MEEINHSLYKVSITVGNICYREEKAYFQLQLSIDDNEGRAIERRFSEIEAMHTDLCTSLPCLPFLPPKSITKLSNKGVEKRKQDLNSYFRALCARADVRRSKEFRAFFSLDIKLTPLLETRGSISSLPSKIVSLDFDTNALVLFALCSDESMATKLTSLWSLVSNSSGGNKSHMLAYQLTRESDNTFSFSKLWGYPSTKGGRIVRWNPGMTILMIGYDDGTVVCLQVKIEQKFTKFEEFCIVRRHVSAISGLEIYEPTAIMFSISRDKTIVLTDLTQSNKFTLNGMILLTKREKL